jgi:hypothetical protein
MDVDKGETNFSEEDKNWSLCYRKSTDNSKYDYPLMNEHYVDIKDLATGKIDDILIDRSINSKHSRYRVPFGNIYNGNK